MRRSTYILLVLCLALYSCGMTDVWKDWEDQGVMSADRLKPSEVKKFLCGADGWKMSYKGIDFYFLFNEGGAVISDTDQNILEKKVESDYFLDFKGEKAVLLTVKDGGALKFLPEGFEKTFVISAYSDRQITATGKLGHESMNFIRVTKADLEKNDEAKRLAIIAKNKALFLERVKTELYNGVIRDASGNFIAHYAISGENYDQIKISVLEDRVLTHYQSDLTITVDNNNGIFSFNPVVLKGKGTKQILYSFDNGSISTDSKLNVSSNKKVISFFSGPSYQTYIISKNNNKGDAKEELWEELGWKSVGDIELSDRQTRPLVLCPGTEDAIWYTFFDLNWLVKGELDRIYFKKSAGYMPFGGADRVSEIEQNLSKFLAGWFHADGLYMVQETNSGTSYIYFLSPTTDNWFKVQR